MGVGTTSPDYRLEVYGSVTGDWLSRIYNTATTGTPNGLIVRTGYNVATATGGYLLGCLAGPDYRFVVQNDGNVGVGTVSPTYNLHIKPSSGNARLKLESDHGSADVEMMLDSAGTTRNAHITFYSAGTQNGGVGYVASDTIMKMWGGNNPADDHLCISSGGCVGIGTATPGYTLEVNGSFGATSKSFIIDHPTKPDKKFTIRLIRGTGTQRLSSRPFSV